MPRNLANISEQQYSEYLLMNHLLWDEAAKKEWFPEMQHLLPQINRILGYDITPFLADLWYDDLPESGKTPD